MIQNCGGNQPPTEQQKKLKSWFSQKKKIVLQKKKNLGSQIPWSSPTNTLASFDQYFTSDVT